MKKLILILLMTPALTWAGNDPAGTCVVSGEKLGSMGTPFTFTHEGTEVTLCCEKCKPKFDKDPAKYTVKAAKPDDGQN